MPRRLILHIGHHKTGSTSLQLALLEHREALLAHGFDYFSLQANHSEPMRAIFEQKHFLETVRMAPEAVKDQRDRVWNALVTQLDASNADFIISGELLSMLPRWSIEELHEALTPLVDEVLVVGYVRPPRSFVSSWSQQRLKRGFPLREMLAGGAPAPRYRHMFEKFFDLFGRERVVLRLFHKDTLQGGCVLADFAEVVGIPSALVKRFGERRVNSAMSMTAGNILALANDRMVELGFRRVMRERVAGRLARLLSDLDGLRYRLPDRVETRIIESCSEEVAWIQDQLGVDFERYDTPADAPHNAFIAPPAAEFDAMLSALVVLAKSR